MRRWIRFLAVFVALAGVLYLLFGRNTPAARPTGLPAVVPEPVEALLQSLEAAIAEHYPDLAPSLRPGIMDTELAAAEASLGQALHPDLRALYRWHNGVEAAVEFFPGHGFYALEEAVQLNLEIKGSVYGFLLASERDWLVLFPDPAGDGYYYDPGRIYETGGVFYVFRENGYYRYFPSLRNLLKAVVEFYQNDLLPYAAQPEDFDFDAQIFLEDQILNRYSVEVIK